MGKSHLFKHTHACIYTLCKKKSMVLAFPHGEEVKNHNPEQPKGKRRKRQPISCLSPTTFKFRMCDLEAFLQWPDVRSGNTLVKLTYSPLLDAFLGSGSGRHGTASAAGCHGRVAAKGSGPACSCLQAQALTRDA